MKSTLLVLGQSLGGILLACIPFVPRLFRNNRLSNEGKLAVFVGAGALLVSITWSHFLDAEQQRKAAERSDSLFYQISRLVMTTSQASEERIVPAASAQVEIVEPAEGSRVLPRQTIRGRAPETSNAVWIIAHPSDTSSYWVQPRVIMQPSGEWSALAYFGRSGAADSGKSFEILAIVDPEEKLAEGTVFDRWPRARLASRARLVLRE